MDKRRYGRTSERERRHDLRDMKRRQEHTLVLELSSASRLILELLAQLVQQLCKTGVGSGNHPTMCVVHFARQNLVSIASRKSRSECDIVQLQR